MKVAKSGFTIVELLIVIVVIAILAAISVVAYNGIQTRANNTKTINSVAAHAKAVALYAAQEGVYPLITYRCLGAVSFCGNMTDTAGGCEGAGRAGGDAALKNALASQATNLPEPSTQAMNCAGKTYSGAWFHTSNNKVGEFRMYLKGNVNPCPSISGTTFTGRFQADDTTTCWVNMPALP